MLGEKQSLMIDVVGLTSLWELLQGQIFLGSDAFIERLQDMIADQESLTEIPWAQRRPLARPLPEYKETIADAKAAMAAAYATGDCTLQEIATCIGVHYSTESRAIKRAEQVGIA